MFSRIRGSRRSAFVVSLAAYAAGILLAIVVTGLGAHRVFTAVIADVMAPQAHSTVVAASGVSRRAAAVISEPPAREASMTPLHASFISLPKGAAAPLPRIAKPAFFGSSSRYWGRPSRRDRDEDDSDEDERPRVSGTYRTLCVRLCDGYYFPISFSVTPDRFARDAKTCESSCGTGQARLFVYRNPGAQIEDMVDLRGQPYRQLGTAFLYRTEYVPACRCKANPWDAEALERHRMYALAADKRKGSKQAAAELEMLAAKMKRDKRERPTQAAQAAPVLPANPGDGASPPLADNGKVRAANPPQDRIEDKSGRMALGARSAREARDRQSRTSGRDSEWMARALGRTF